jgi:hypothetical protein
MAGQWDDAIDRILRPHAKLYKPRGYSPKRSASFLRRIEGKVIIQGESYATGGKTKID